MRITLIISLFLLAAIPLSAEPLPLKVKAEAAILMNADTGAILYEKNSRTLMNPASITKIATALYALKLKPRLDERILITKEMVNTTTEEAKKKSGYKLPPHLQEVGGTHMGLKEGEEVPLKDLFYGMMLASANDGANAIGIHCGGTMDNFMKGVNEHLRGIGCKQTTYYNPHGLYYPGHKTTAYDLAIMTREALKDPLFREIVRTTVYTKEKTNLQPPFTFTQSNKLLRSGPIYYSQTIGVKTGYIRAAGHTFVAAATQEGRTLIAVVLKCKERKDIFPEARKMFEAAFSESPVERIALNAGPQDFKLNVSGAKKPVQAVLKEKLAYTCYPSEEPQIKCLLFWDTLAPPIAMGQRIGELRLTTPDGVILTRSSLYAVEAVDASWSHKLVTSLSNFWNKFSAVAIVVVCVVILGLIYFILKIKPRIGS